MRIHILIVLLLLTFIFHSCSSTRSIDNFSTKIVEESNYGMFWEGYVDYKQDTLFFVFVGNVRYRVSENKNEDILCLKQKKDQEESPYIITIIYREVADMLNRPVINKSKGKEMTKWSFTGNNKHYALKQIKNFLKNGKITYYHVPKNESEAIKKMKNLYGISSEQAIITLNKMTDP